MGANFKSRQQEHEVGIKGRGTYDEDLLQSDLVIAH